jgi:sporulation protein YlmC with PRC-barrel domain
MSRLCLSDLQRMRVVTEKGERLGHVFDVAADLERPDRPPTIRALLVGRGGLARRLGVGRGRATEIPVDRIARVDGGTIVVGAGGDRSRFRSR